MDLAVRKTPPRARAGAGREVRVDAVDVEGEVQGAAAVGVDGRQRHLDHLRGRRVLFGVDCITS